MYVLGMKEGWGSEEVVMIKDVSTPGTGVEGVWCVQAMRSRDRDRCFGDNSLAGDVLEGFNVGILRCPCLWPLLRLASRASGVFAATPLFHFMDRIMSIFSLR